MPDQFFDFGEARPEDLERVAREIEQRGYGQLDDNTQQRQGSAWIASQFLRFLSQAVRELGLVDVEGRVRACPMIAAAVNPNLPDHMKLQEFWDRQAKDWAVIETPLNYAITMATLMEHLKIDDRVRRETILSLGSGPGLYETFLASCLAGLPSSEHVTVVAVDYAPRMTQMHKQLLAKLRLPDGRKLTNIRPVTDDMKNLSSFDAGSVDQIICNNALQWVHDWRSVIAEMARVIKPEGLGWVYLFVHRHAMAIGDVQTGNPLIEVPEVPLDELLDELEAKRFQVRHMRQFTGQRGTGQGGGRTNRVFVLAKYRHEEEFSSWRDAEISSSLGVFSMES